MDLEHLCSSNEMRQQEVPFVICNSSRIKQLPISITEIATHSGSGEAIQIVRLDSPLKIECQAESYLDSAHIKIISISAE